MLPRKPIHRTPGTLSIPQTGAELRPAIIAGFTGPAGAALADKLGEAGFFPVAVASAHHALAVARVRDIALVAIDAEHLPDSAARLIRDLRNLPGKSAKARILAIGFYLPDTLRISLTEAGADAILTMLDDDTTGGSFDRLLGRR